ncbi:YggS family pyridoxal phosphate-dependent enzyme [Sulfurospirillum sp. T05]|uniref:Pyridoxal phosphate homeostasis protein n=1 Tax=Sulfurospirillum tamanense TaxID=2813362 RepID=A0ABS2WR45_9BACT|nr:YggS family pyridoxal phosphate-dependent enzyme [Sulfurospirillum tamanensis]MBN2964136.1 YggS family pyridoxal phosphate-dependent enzyme [Sulfurospirillum tamanensis]
MNFYESTLDTIFTRIEAVRTAVNQHQIIKLVAVSKSVEPHHVETMYQAGQRAFGENKVQELARKNQALSTLPLEWHFIGRLQKNKINALIDLSPSLVHSCDSLELAVAFNKRLHVKEKTLSVLLQINSAKEDSKAGVMPEHAIETYLAIKETCPNLVLKGVMSIGAHTNDVALIQQSFETTYRLYESLTPHGAKVCSMGMSEDFELAIRCGANMLRLGSVLFT